MAPNVWKATLSDVTLENICLNHQPIRTIDNKKLKSLSKKYHAILHNVKEYYPDISSLDLIDTNFDKSNDPKPRQGNKKKEARKQNK